MGLPQKVWERLKRLGVVRRFVPDISGRHPQSLGRVRKVVIVKRKRGHSHVSATQHERVVAGRAKILKISVEEYHRRFSNP